MRNALTNLAETVKDPEQKKASGGGSARWIQTDNLTSPTAVRDRDGQLLLALPPVPE